MRGDDGGHARGGELEATAMQRGASVTVRDRGWRVEADTPFRFGRSDDADVVGLDERDLGISRCAGEVRVDDSGAWVVNLSASQPLWLDLGAGHLTVLAPGQRQVVPGARAVVVVRGAILEHALEIEIDGVDEEQTSPVAVPSGQRTITPLDLVSLTDAERDALVAVVADYLQPPPRRRTLPRGYEEAASLLADTTASTVRKRIERIIAKFAASGIYFTGADARHELADYVVEHGIVSPGDLTRLDI